MARNNKFARQSSIMERQISRRNLVKVAGVTGLSAMGLTALAGCDDLGPFGGDDTTSVTMFVWVGSNQGVVPREVRDEYLEDNPNVEFELLEGTNADTYPRIVASLETTPDDPLVNFGFCNVDMATRGTLDDVWLPLDEESVPNLNLIYPEFRRENDLGVFWGMSAIGLVYHKELVDPPPSSWNDLWDERFHGQVAFWDAPAWSFNGLVATARMNGGDENNIQPGMDVYAEAAADGHIHSLFNSNDQLRQLMVNGEVLIAPFFKGIMTPWEEEGAPIGYVVPDEGQIAFPLGHVMVRGSDEDQQRVAQEMINRMLDPNALGRYCSLTGSIPASAEAELDPQYVDDPAFLPENVEGAMQLDWEAIARNTDEWTDMWDREVRGNLA